jgi:hypothetical protein
VTRSATAGSLPHALSVVLGVAIPVIGSACRSATVPADACRPPGGRIDASSRSDFMAWAGGLSYLPRDSTRAFVYGFPRDSVRIEAVSQTAGPQGQSIRGCVYARLTSVRAYPALGIGTGANYLWTDSLPGGYRSVTIPADSAIPITVHPLVLHAHTPGAPPPPQIGAYGGCAQCKQWWCRTGLDSIGVARMTRPDELSRLRAGGPMM